MAKGWISLHRELQDHWLWRDEIFTKGQAWVDLLMLATHKNGKGVSNGKVLIFEKGKVYKSVKFLADRWSWSRGKVVRFLKLLEKEEMITYEQTPFGTSVSLINYSFYQYGSEKTDTPRTPHGHPLRTLIK